MAPSSPRPEVAGAGDRGGVHGGDMVGLCETTPTPNASHVDPFGDGVMRWLSRSLWLVAWSFWLWLGFGLYRELPRDLGRIERNLSLEPDETAIAFSDYARRLVTQRIFRRDFSGGSSLSVYDIDSGARVSSIEAPVFNFPFNDPCVRRGIVIAGGGFGAETPLKAADLETGAWTSLSVRPATFRDLHPSRPWAALISDRSEADETHVLVVDVSTGAEVFSRPFLPERRVAASPPRFAAIGDRLIIPAASKEYDGPRFATTHFEVWLLSGAPRLERVIESPRTLGGIKDAAAQRMVVTDLYGTVPFDVFDLDTGACLYSEPERRPPLGIGAYANPVFLSRDGRTFVGYLLPTSQLESSVGGSRRLRMSVMSWRRW